MTDRDLIDLFVKTLIREFGKNRRHWRTVLGDVRLYSVETHPHCNWSITPNGDSYENAAVERLADRLRGEHPIIKD
ncbi:MAG: hypothetical protein EOP61_11155 [Sphingomonadales bacterium]|nr:MAG: hypothetical protein EOP61_11155 [Sphingomonadales bacterium]